MSSVVVVDVGTSNVKVGTVDPSGELLSHASRELAVERPEKGAAEHDPVALFDVLLSLIREVAGDQDDTIEGLVLSGYHGGFLPLDRDMQPLTGLITLLDTRTKVVMDQFEREFPMEEIYQKTGCPSLFIYALPRLFWLRKEKPDVFTNSRYFSDVKGYLLYRLAGSFSTEPSVASATQMINIRENDWDDGILDMARIGRESLPEVVDGDTVVGDLSGKVARTTGLPEGTPVISGVYDGGSMILGMGGYSGEVGICNIGTTAMIRTCASEPILDSVSPPRLQTYSLLPDRWAIGGAVNNAGISLKWFRDTLSIGDGYEEIITRARGVGPGADGVFCLPFLTGERDPRVGNMASGVFFGIKDYHTSGHLSRSILEGVAYSLRMVLESLQDNEIQVDSLRIGGSGAKSDLWPSIVSDVLNLSVTKSMTPDATLIGSAMVAFTRLGKYSSLAEATDAMVRTGKVFEPDEDRQERYMEAYDFFVELISKLRDMYPSHAAKFLGTEN
ncbi:MAG: gluconokinase [Candidatus Acetothermia bacterium]